MAKGNIIYNEITTSTEIDSIAKKTGQLLFTTDTEKIYLDTSSSNRIQIAEQDAILYNITQNLTNEQKENARNNIDAKEKDLIVTGTIDDDTTLVTGVNATFNEIKDAYESGRNVFFQLKMSEIADDAEMVFIFNLETLYYIPSNDLYIACFIGNNSAITLVQDDNGALFGMVEELNEVDSSLSTTSTNAIQNKAVSRLTSTLIPVGTQIGSNVDLNTLTYIKVGNYYCSTNATAATLINCPTTSAFMMQVYSPLSPTIDNESSSTWVYRLRKIITLSGDEYYQYVNSGTAAGTFSYGSWKKIINTNDIVDRARKDANGNTITSTYETKTDAASKLTEAKGYADSTAATLKNELLNGAGAAYDTLKELGDLIDTNVDAIDALEIVASNKMDKVNPTGTGIFSINRKAGTTAGNYSMAVGQNVTASADESVAVGYQTVASGSGAFAEGGASTASGAYSHAKGRNTLASGDSSSAEGNTSVASGIEAHAEGRRTQATGDYGSHAEGMETYAKGYVSHTEGYNTIAAEGTWMAHAEGESTTAAGDNSHSEGVGTIANGRAQHVQGEYNIADSATSASERGTYAHIIGNGTADNARSNAYALDWSGNAYFAGSINGTGGTLTGPLSITDGSRTTKYAHGSVSFIPDSSAAMGLSFYTSDGNTRLSSLGALIQNDSLQYLYFGGTYDNPWIKLNSSTLTSYKKILFPNSTHAGTGNYLLSFDSAGGIGASTDSTVIGVYGTSGVYMGTSTGNRIFLASDSLSPTSGSFSLGTSENQWNNIYSSGIIYCKANQYEDSHSGSLNLRNSNIYGVNGIYTSDLADSAAEGINFYNTSTTVDSIWAKSGIMYFTPNRTLGTTGTNYTVYHSGNIGDHTNKFYDSTISRTANTVLAAPNGSAGGATFRKLVAADLPSHTHSYLPLSGGTMTGNILISHTTSGDMAYTSTNPKIGFAESGSQPVYIIYTDYDSYRAPAGLKIIGSQGSEWLEVEGNIYHRGGSVIPKITSGTAAASGGSSGDIYIKYS